MSSPSPSDRELSTLRDDANASSPTHSNSSGVGGGYNLAQQQSSNSLCATAGNVPSWAVDGSSSSNQSSNRQWSGSTANAGINGSLFKLPSGCSSAAEYLSQLVKDKKQLSNFQYLFFHVERLLDKGELAILISLNICVK